MTTETPADNQNNTRVDSKNEKERAEIGKWIIFCSLIFIGLIAAVAIWSAGKDTNSGAGYQHVKDILGMILPVVGTWVGTILAFYFSKENFVAAAQQTSNLVRQLTPEQKLETIAVEQVMLSITSPQTVKLTLDKKEEDIKLKADILDVLLPEGAKNRLPCLDPEGKIRYIIHRSIIEGFISRQALSGTANLADLTLKDLLASDQIQHIATAFGTVGQTAKLNAAKAIMDANPECSDVFVTLDGTKNSKALGWITNVILIENSRV